MTMNLFRNFRVPMSAKLLAWAACGAIGLAVASFAQELPRLPEPAPKPESGEVAPPPAGPTMAPAQGVVVFTEIPEDGPAAGSKKGSGAAPILYDPSADVAPLPPAAPKANTPPPAPPVTKETRPEAPPALVDSLPTPPRTGVLVQETPPAVPTLPAPPAPSVPPVSMPPVQSVGDAPLPPIPAPPAPPAQPRAETKPAAAALPRSMETQPVAFQEPKGPPPATEKIKVDPLETAPAPRPIELFPNHPRLQRLPGVPGPLGTTPNPSKKEIEEYNKYVKEFVDPRNTLDLVQGRTRLMVLTEVPKRIQIGNETVAIYNLVTPKEITVLGKQVGTTILNLWFADPENKEKEKILSYLVRVIPDPEEKERLEAVYKALQDEINKTFPDSLVHLKLVGDKLVVSGQVHDITQATHILNIVKANAPGGNQNKNEPEPGKIPLSADPTLRPGDPGNIGGTPGLEDFRSLGGPNVINLLRIPGEQQVMLRVTVAEVNRSAARSIGLNFSVQNNNGVTVFANRTGQIATGGPLASFGFGGLSNTTGLGTSIAGLATNNLPISLDNGQVSLALNALRNINYARSLAEPNLVALNGQTATFHAGGQFPVPVVSGNTFSGLAGANFVPYGVNLQFTPFVLDRDRIRLNVAATVSTRDLSTGSAIGGSFVSGLSSRNFQTTVELREGQTLAVAGLIQNNLGADATRVPFFGDIPVLNRFAGFDRTSAGEQEVVVLITPELVHPMDCKEAAQVPLPGADLFEPGDLEFYLLGRLESRRAYDYRSPVMNDWDRMRSYRHCEQLYIFGPSGYGN